MRVVLQDCRVGTFDSSSDSDSDGPHQGSHTDSAEARGALSAAVAAEYWEVGQKLRTRCPRLMAILRSLAAARLVQRVDQGMDAEGSDEEKALEKMMTSYTVVAACPHWGRPLWEACTQLH